MQPTENDKMLSLGAQVYLKLKISLQAKFLDFWYIMPKNHVIMSWDLLHIKDMHGAPFVADW